MEPRQVPDGTSEAVPHRGCDEEIVDDEHDAVDAPEWLDLLRDALEFRERAPDVHEHAAHAPATAEPVFCHPAYEGLYRHSNAAPEVADGAHGRGAPRPTP